MKELKYVKLYEQFELNDDESLKLLNYSIDEVIVIPIEIQQQINQIRGFKLLNLSGVYVAMYNNNLFFTSEGSLNRFIHCTGAEYRNVNIVEKREGNLFCAKLDYSFLFDDESESNEKLGELIDSVM